MRIQRVVEPPKERPLKGDGTTLFHRFCVALESHRLPVHLTAS